MQPNELAEVVAHLRKQGRDDACYEAKACKDKLSSDVWESVSAFGNTDGGTLLLGLDERSGFLRVEPFQIEKVIDQFVEGIGDGGERGKKVENPPQYSLERVDFEGGQVIVIELDEVENRFKPCYIKKRSLLNGSFKRVDDKDIKLTATEIFELQHVLEPSPADREPVCGAQVHDFDENLVDSLIAAEKRRGSKAVRGVSSTDEALRRMGAMTPDNDISLAGLLTLGLYPQQFYPKLVADVTVHPSIEKSDPEAPRFLDRVICEGPIAEVIDDALFAVAKNLRTFSYVEGSTRRDELEIPREVLREAIANALIHREYGTEFMGQSVSVDIFPDRVEITNPGGLWGGKTIRTLADGQSRCRNGSLIKLASRMQSAAGGSPVEGQGSGIPLMYREMRSHALREPSFDAGTDYFKVTLQRGGAELSRNREWLDGISSRKTNSREEAVLLELNRNECLTVHELRNALGYDSDDIRIVAARLVADGLIKEGPDDTYRIANPEKWSSERYPKKTAREAILDVLAEASEPMGIRDIANAAQRKTSTLRAQIAALVSRGEVIATAPPTSPNRKYYLADRNQLTIDSAL